MAATGPDGVIEGVVCAFGVSVLGIRVPARGGRRSGGSVGVGRGWQPRCGGRGWWPATTGWRTGRLAAKVRVFAFFSPCFFERKGENKKEKGNQREAKAETPVRKGFTAVWIKSSDTNLM